MQRFAVEDGEGAGREHHQRRQQKMNELKSFETPEEFPKDLRPSKVRYLFSLYLFKCS